MYKTAYNKMLPTLVLSLVFSLMLMMFLSSVATAKSNEIDFNPQPMSAFDDVMNTYRTFTGLDSSNIPRREVMYGATYKQLAYRSGYSQTAPTLIYEDSISADDIPEYIDSTGTYTRYPGTISVWRCNYTVW